MAELSGGYHSLHLETLKCTELSLAELSNEYCSEGLNPDRAYAA
jgi:hypothetical protein